MKKLLAIVLTLVLALMMAVPASAQYYYTFDDIFTDRWIIHMPALFLMLDYYAYAYVTPDGVIDCMEYGADGNVICEWVETIYFPTEGLSEEDVDIMEYNLLANFSAIDAEDFCEVSSYQMSNYISITIKFTDLENKANVVRLADLGLADYGIDYLGIDLTEQNLLAQGYVKDTNSSN